MKYVMVFFVDIALISFIFASQERCGKEYGKCDSGECCSQYGYCGRSDDHCLISRGCQSQYSTCKDSSDSGDSSSYKWSNEYGTVDKEARTYCQQIWDYLYNKIGNKYGVAGMMGNLYEESRLKPVDLEKEYREKFGMTSEEYTKAVDNGSYKKFTTDKAGYGLVQWTSESRKAKLLQYAKDHGKSIGDLNMQLDFFWKEINEKYSGVVEVLMNAQSVREASNKVLLEYEQPVNAEKQKSMREKYGQMIKTALNK